MVLEHYFWIKIEMVEVLFLQKLALQMAGPLKVFMMS